MKNFNNLSVLLGNLRTEKLLKLFPNETATDVTLTELGKLPEQELTALLGRVTTEKLKALFSLHDNLKDND